MATLEWLLASVCSLIYYRTRDPRECLITKAALKRFLPSMSSMASRNHDRLEYKMASPQCVFSCCSSVRMSQWLLWAGVSPVWVLLCASYALKEDKVHEKVLSQRMQWSGFSPYEFSWRRQQWSRGCLMWPQLLCNKRYIVLVRAGYPRQVINELLNVRVVYPRFLQWMLWNGFSSKWVICITVGISFIIWWYTLDKPMWQDFLTAK